MIRKYLFIATFENIKQIQTQKAIKKGVGNNAFF